MGQGKQLKEKIWDYYQRSMPYCDKTDIAPEVLEAYADHACWLREHVEWCRKLPEDIFLEHVAAYRINNERIEDCRKLFYELVMPCIDKLPLREAILEVNLWCSVHVTYHPADERTANALTAYKSGFGRCGEESVFTVTILRSVGIAARQVYAPLWSHCDDNHAWVEVYCDGQWHYLGACEPEPVWDRGWFDLASSRAMLIHGRSFAGIPSRERVISREGCAVYYAVTDRYARTAEAEFLVRLPDGEALRQAMVNLEILNYADYGRIARIRTDGQGRFGLLLGLGSVRLSCVWERKLYCKNVEVTGDGQMQVTLERPDQERWMDSAFWTPEGREKKDPEKQAALEAPAEFAKKLERAKQARRERLDSFFGRLDAAKFPEAAQEILRQAGGNLDQLAAFLKKDDNSYRLKLLEALSQKDYYDARAEVLEEHLQYALPYAGAEGVPEEIFVNCLLNPRLDYEELSAYRREILDWVGAQAAELARNPEKIWAQYCREIRMPKEDAYDTLYKLPVSVLKDQRGSRKDQNNLFVAIARSCGVPARLNPVTKEAEYYRKGRFCPASGGKQEKVRVILKGKPGESYLYPGNFSFARWEKDHYQVWDLSRKVWEEGRLVLEAEAGEYRIITAQRLEDGSQLAKELYVTLESGERCIELKLPKRRENQRTAVVLPEAAVKGNGVFGKRAAYLWIREGEEPTEHLLHELLERAREAAGHRKQIFLLSEKEALEGGLLQKLEKETGGLPFYPAEDFGAAQIMAEAMGLERGKYPLAVVVDEEGRGVYGTCGYHVGSAALILERL